MVNPKKLETGIRTISAGIPYTLLFRIEAKRFPTFGPLLYTLNWRRSEPTCRPPHAASRGTPGEAASAGQERF